MKITLRKNGRIKNLAFTTANDVKPERPRIQVNIELHRKSKTFESRRKELIGKLFNFG